MLGWHRGAEKPLAWTVIRTRNLWIGSQAPYRLDHWLSHPKVLRLIIWWPKQLKVEKKNHHSVASEAWSCCTRQHAPSSWTSSSLVQRWQATSETLRILRLALVLMMVVLMLALLLKMVMSFVKRCISPWCWWQPVRGYCLWGSKIHRHQKCMFKSWIICPYKVTYDTAKQDLLWSSGWEPLLSEFLWQPQLGLCPSEDDFIFINAALNCWKKFSIQNSPHISMM